MTMTKIAFNQGDFLFRREIERAVHAGYVHGDDSGYFRPTDGITRAEMAAVVANALAIKNPPAAEPGFAADASIPAWAKGAVAELKKLGLLAGKGANAFDPNGLLTRAEAVTILSKVLEQK